MELYTVRWRIQNVLNRWKVQYPTTKEGVCSKLSALNLNTATKKEVDDIIGNGTWTRLTCDECQKDVDSVIEVGEAFTNSTASLCKDCITKAYKQMTA